MVANSLTVRWNAHYSALLELLKDSRREGWFCDATICCNGNFYSVHKFVLAACSAYFEELFSKVREGNPMIIMTDIKTYRLEALLSYMYDGEVNILQKEFAGVMEAAKALKIRGLCNTPEQEQRPQRKIQRDPLQNDIVPGPDQLCEHSNVRTDLNVSYVQCREIRALSPLPVGDVFPSSNNDGELIGSPNIPSIVPGSTVSLKASDKSNGAARSLLVLPSGLVQQGESSSPQLGPVSQNFEVNAIHDDDSTENTLVMELKLECEEMIQSSSAFQAEEMFTGFSLKESHEHWQNIHCESIVDSREQCNNITGVEENSIQIESALTSMQPSDSQAEINKTKNVLEMDTQNDVSTDRSELSKKDNAKKRRNIRLPKRFYTPDKLEGKRNLRKKNTNKRTCTIDENISKEMQPPKRKIGRPRKYHLPQTMHEGILDPTVPLQSNHNDSPFDSGVAENAKSSKQHVKNLPSDVSQRYDQESCTLSSEVNQSDQVTSFTNVPTRNDDSEVTPGTLDQVQADSINKSLRSVKCLSASKRRTKLLRQFRKNVPIDSIPNDSVSEEKMICFKSTNAKYNWHARKKLSKAKRWSRPKQHVSLKNKVSRNGMSCYNGINFDKSMRKQVIESLSSFKNLKVKVEKLDQLRS